jgi:8-oxo-dGTP pyrophosphatase MutT (NUDIX family)
MTYQNTYSNPGTDLAHSTVQKSGYRGLLKSITEAEALKLRHLEGQATIATAVFMPCLIEKVPHTLLCEKQTDFGRTTGIPCGKMKSIDKDFFDTATREVTEETGIAIKKLEFLFAGEFTSTLLGIRHYKIFLVSEDCAEEPKLIGAPDQGKIKGHRRVIIDDELHSKITGQTTGAIGYLIKKLMNRNPDYGWALMNTWYPDKFPML